jgi:hypothetical protein
MGFLVFLVLIAVSASQTTVVSAGDAGVLASSPLAGWAIALLVVSSILVSGIRGCVAGEAVWQSRTFPRAVCAAQKNEN